MKACLDSCQEESLQLLSSSSISDDRTMHIDSQNDIIVTSIDVEKSYDRVGGRIPGVARGSEG